MVNLAGGLNSGQYLYHTSNGDFPVTLCACVLWVNSINGSRSAQLSAWKLQKTWRYCSNSWLTRSVSPLVCGWNAVDRADLTPSLFQILHVTKPLLQTSRTILDAPIRFLLRRPNRCQDRRSLRRSFPEYLITCIVTLIPNVTHDVQSSRDSRLSRFHEVSELLSQPPPVSIRKTYSHTHNSRAAQ